MKKAENSIEFIFPLQTTYISHEMLYLKKIAGGFGKTLVKCKWVPHVHFKNSCNSPFSSNVLADKVNHDIEPAQVQHNLENQVFEASSNETTSTKESKLRKFKH